MEGLSQQANSLRLEPSLMWHLSKSLRLEILGTEKLSILRALVLNLAFESYCLLVSVGTYPLIV